MIRRRTGLGLVEWWWLQGEKIGRIKSAETDKEEESLRNRKTL